MLARKCYVGRAVQSSRWSTRRRVFLRNWGACQSCECCRRAPGVRTFAWQPDPFWQVKLLDAQVQPLPMLPLAEQLVVWFPFMYSSTAQKVKSSLGSEDTLTYSPQ